MHSSRKPNKKTTQKQKEKVQGVTTYAQPSTQLHTEPQPQPPPTPKRQSHNRRQRTVQPAESKPRVAWRIMN